MKDVIKIALSEYRKTAHDGEFEFKNTNGNMHSLSHRDVVKKINNQKESLLREITKFYQKKQK